MVPTESPIKSPNAEVQFPPAPESLEQTGLPASFVEALLLKILYYRGTITGQELSSHLCLPFKIIEPLIQNIANEKMCQPVGLSPNSQAPELAARFNYTITTVGRARAHELIAISQYAGPAPVPVETYAQVARLQAQGAVKVSRKILTSAASDLVMPDSVFDQLGPAVSGRETVFLYGPPGNGKTSIATHLGKLLGPPLFIPRALYVYGEVIRFYDPVPHHAIEQDIAGHDRRWLLIERPIVKAGGELRFNMLDLGFDPTLGFYEAPLQLKANGGLFLIDDFGRQRDVPPADLLNRLIVPLEAATDYLNIARAGTSVSVPFTPMLILSTNIHPDSLIDEAFLRRLHYKVFIPNPTEKEYIEIWRRQAIANGVQFDEAVVLQMMNRIKEDGHAKRGVHARDLLNHAAQAARYHGVPATMSKELMDLAYSTYFIEGRKERWG